MPHLKEEKKVEYLELIYDLMPLPCNSLCESLNLTKSILEKL